MGWRAELRREQDLDAAFAARLLLAVWLPAAVAFGLFYVLVILLLLNGDPGLSPT